MACPAVDLTKTNVIRLRSDIEWLPDYYRNRVKRIRIKYKSSSGEKHLFRKRKKIAPSRWAPKNRKITYGPLKGSNYDPMFMPHMNGIIDTFVLPFVEELGNCKAPQTGSSAGAETAIGYLVDMDPADTLIIYPDRETAGKRAKDYLKPMFLESPRLKSLMTGVADDVAAFRIKLKTMLIYMGWAGSVMTYSNISVKYIVVDEADKNPEQASKKEAATDDLIGERNRAFTYGSKIWWNSTASVPTGTISRFLERAEVVLDYFPKCPDCGQRHHMLFDHIRFGDTRDPELVEAEDLARYYCPGCGSEWDDRKRNKALEQGEWFARLPDWKQQREKGKPWGHDPRPRLQYLMDERPATVCFHSPGWVSKQISLSECASAFLKGLKSKLAMRYFVTQIKAEPFLDYEVQRAEDQIIKLKDDRPAGLVPGNNQVAALVAGGDTQDNGFYYFIMALGWGLEQPWWSIREGFTEHLATAEKRILEEEYKDAEGNVYPVHLWVQDAMGHRTTEIYNLARRYPGRVIPYKGASGRRPNPIVKTKIDRYPGGSTLIPGGVTLYTCDSHHYKDQVATKMAVSIDDPGAFRLHSGTTAEFCQHMCVEYVDDRGMWQQPRGKAQHYWDCVFMAGIAADVLQVKFWPKVERTQPKPQKQVQANPYTGGRQLFGGR